MTLFFVFVLLLEVCIVASIFILNNLTTIKGGIMKHVYSKKIQYAQSIHSESLLLKQSVLAIIFTIVFSILLIYAIKNHKSLLLKVELTIGIAISLFIPIVINSKFFIDKLSYSYFIMASEIIFLIQFLIIIVLMFKETIYSKHSQ